MTGHFEPQHLAHLILGFGTTQPADAADAAAAFYDYSFSTSTRTKSAHAAACSGENEQAPHFGGRTLGKALESAIDRAARCFLDPAVRPQLHQSGYLPHRLVLSPNNKRASIVWISPNGREECIDHYIAPEPTTEELVAGAPSIFSPAFSESAVIATDTRIAAPLIIVAGELWADTLARRGAPLPSSDTPPASGITEDGDGGSPAGAQPKTENGAEGAPARASTAPLNNGVQPRANGTSSSHSAENRETEAKPQGLSSREWLDTPSHMSMCRHRRPGAQPHAVAFP